MQSIADAIETQLAELDDAPREIDERCRLFSKYLQFTAEERLQIDPETRERLLYYGASALEEAGKNESALRAFEELLAEQTTLLGENDRATLATRQRIAAQQAQLGHVEVALASLAELLIDRQRVFGDDKDPDILANRHDLAFWQAHSEQTAAAVDQYRILVRDSEKTLGSTARPTLRRRQLLASELSNLGRHDEAIALSTSLTEQFENVMGRNHPDTFISRQRQAVILGQSGQSESACTET